MTVRILEREFPTDHLPLLRWMVFTGVCSFGFVLCWYYGLFHLMFVSDKTYISATITVLYVATTVHCFVRTTAISREFDNANRVLAMVSRGVTGFSVAGANVITADGSRLPPGHVTNHIRNLILKAGLQGHHRLDQTLLLRGLADALRGPNQLGSFASDARGARGALLTGPCHLSIRSTGTTRIENAPTASSCGSSCQTSFAGTSACTATMPGSARGSTLGEREPITAQISSTFASGASSIR